MSSEKSRSEFQTGPLKGLTPNVIWLGIVSLLADISSEMLYPITPIFLQTVIGAPIAAIGIIEGLAEATASFLKSYSGKRSDQSGIRRPWIFWGYLLSALSRPLISLAYGWPLVLVARVLDRTGKGFRTSPRDALLADSVRSENRGRAFGLHRGMDTLGAVIGPLTAIGLISYLHDNLRSVYLWAAIPGILAAFFVFFSKEVKQKRAIEVPIQISFKHLPPRFRSYLFICGIFAISNSSDAFLLLKAKQNGASTATVILMYCIYNLVYALASPSLGALSDRLGRKPFFIIGLLIFAGVYCGFALSTSSTFLWVLFALYGLYMAATDGIGKALAIDLVPSHMKGTALGALGTVTGLATLVASTTAGVLWTSYGSSVPFLFGACGAGVAAVLLISSK